MGMLFDSDQGPPRGCEARSLAEWTRLTALLPSMLCALLLVAACGADGTEAPWNASPVQLCPTLDERLEHVRSALARGQLEALNEVLTRLQQERGGAQLERTLRLVLQILQELPREEATNFEFDLVLDLVDQTRDTMVRILRFLSTGPDQRREVFPVIAQVLLECPRDSLILAGRDVFEATGLMEAAGSALTDPLVVQLLANIPDQPEQGRAGFVALFRAVVNAVQSPNFDFAQIQELLSFLNLDEPPVSDLLDELNVFLRDERLEHVRTAVACLQSRQLGDSSGVDVFGAFFYDLITLDGLDFGQLLTLMAPIMAQLKDPQIQTLGGAIIDGMLVDVELRDLAIELTVFLLRDDNLLPILRSLEVLFESRGIDDFLLVMAGLTVRCPESMPSDGGTHAN